MKLGFAFGAGFAATLGIASLALAQTGVGTGIGTGVGTGLSAPSAGVSTTTGTNSSLNTTAPGSATPGSTIRYGTAGQGYSATSTGSAINPSTGINGSVNGSA